MNKALILVVVICLEIAFVRGYSLVPEPPASIIPFISSSDPPFSGFFLLVF